MARFFAEPWGLWQVAQEACSSTMCRAVERKRRLVEHSVCGRDSRSRGYRRHTISRVAVDGGVVAAQQVLNRGSVEGPRTPEGLLLPWQSVQLNLLALTAPESPTAISRPKALQEDERTGLLGLVSRLDIEDARGCQSLRSVTLLTELDFESVRVCASTTFADLVVAR